MVRHFPTNSSAGAAGVTLVLEPLVIVVWQQQQQVLTKKLLAFSLPYTFRLPNTHGHNSNLSPAVADSCCRRMWTLQRPMSVYIIRSHKDIGHYLWHDNNNGSLSHLRPETKHLSELLVQKQ